MDKMKNFKTYAVSRIICSSFLIISCATAPPLLNLSPLEGKVEWLHGKQYVTQRDSRIKYVLAFEGYRNSLLKFDVKIKNNSRRSILIDPSSFYYVPLETKSKEIPVSKFVFAGNPEEEILKLQAKIIQEKTDYKNDQTANEVSGCLGSFFSIADKTEEDRRSSEELQERVRRDKRSRERLNIRKLSLYKRSIEFWKTEALRKNTLKPGQSISGIIVFPARHKADKVLLFTQGEKKVMMFPFQQKQVVLRQNTY